jgi:hypothetical protein
VGEPPSCFFDFWEVMYPGYVRGQAYLALHQSAQAAAEFQKIVDHRGIVISDPIGALAHLQFSAWPLSIHRWPQTVPRTGLLFSPVLPDNGQTQTLKGAPNSSLCARASFFLGNIQLQSVLFLARILTKAALDSSSCI